MLAWCGLERYGYIEDAQRLAYRWLYMCVLSSAALVSVQSLTDTPIFRLTLSFASYNGLVPEKVRHKSGASEGSPGD